MQIIHITYTKNISTVVSKIKQDISWSQQQWGGPWIIAKHTKESFVSSCDQTGFFTLYFLVSCWFILATMILKFLDRLYFLKFKIFFLKNLSFMWVVLFWNSLFTDRAVSVHAASLQFPKEKDHWGCPSVCPTPSWKQLLLHHVQDAELYPLKYLKDATHLLQTGHDLSQLIVLFLSLTHRLWIARWNPTPTCAPGICLETLKHGSFKENSLWAHLELRTGVTQKRRLTRVVTFQTSWDSVTLWILHNLWRCFQTLLKKSSSQVGSPLPVTSWLWWRQHTHPSNNWVIYVFP